MLDFNIPAVGENISSGKVTEVYVSVGDTIKKDQDLVELETDKASIPIPSPVDGVVKEVLINAYSIYFKRCGPDIGDQLFHSCVMHSYRMAV